MSEEIRIRLRIPLKKSAIQNNVSVCPGDSPVIDCETLDLDPTGLLVGLRAGPKTSSRPSTLEILSFR